MKQLIALLTLSLSVNNLSAQSLTPEEGAKRVGDSVKVCGKVFGGRFLENAKGTPTLLNMGAAYPNSTFTIVMYSEARKKFTYQPEIELVNKNVCFSGKVVLFREKPQIVVTETNQVEVQQ